MTIKRTDVANTLFRFYRYLQKQEYNPGFVGLFVNPFYFSRRGLWRGIRRFAPYLTGRVLDVGCGRKPYRSLLRCAEYVGMDTDQSGHSHAGEAIDVTYSGEDFPLADASFDGVLCTQVLEHVFNPIRFLSQVARVLKPGGYLLLSVPFAWDEHEQPYDFARYSSFGVNHLLEKSEFHVVFIHKTMCDYRALAQLHAMYFFKVMGYLRKTWVGAFLCSLIIATPANLCGWLLGWLLPSNNDFYLDAVVLARKKMPKTN